MTSARQPQRGSSEPDEDHIDLAVTRVQPPSGAPRMAAAMWLVAAFVVLAVVKPWGGAGPAAATLPRDVAVLVDVTPAPTEDRTATGLAVPVCLGAGAWRIATLETWRNRDVRVWRAIEPVTSATGALDPTIPLVPVVADVLSGLGWCAPAFGPDQPSGPARVQAWQVIGGVARQVFLRQVQPATGNTPIAALYLPVTGAWRSGVVVFQYRDDSTGLDHWFGAELQILAAPPSPSPPSSAAP